MASQDETPTHRPTTPGEPPNGAADSAPAEPDSRIGSRSGAHSARSAGSPVLPGPDEHADWDAEFNTLAGSAGEEDRTGTDADDAVAPETAPDVSVAGKGDMADGDVPDPAAGSTDSTASGASAAPAAPGPSAAGAATVPGGHPSLAQRSELPMRRASTLPDLSAYEHDGAPDGRRENHDGHDGDAAGGSGEPRDRHDRRDGDSSRDGDDTRDSDDTRESDDSRDRHPAAEPGPETLPGQARGPVRDDGSRPVTPDEALSPGMEQDQTRAGTAQPVEEQAGEPVAPTGDPVAEGEQAGAAGAVVAADPAGLRETDGGGGDTDAEARPAVVTPEEAERRAKEREKAAAGKPVLARVLQVMVAVFFPVVVLAAAVRAVATPLFLWAEYHRPGFPDDAYGFTTDDRMTYGSYAVDYLTNLSGSRYLGDLVGDGGQPLYLASEVSHMADVKAVLTWAFAAAAVMVILGLFALLYLRRRSPGGIRRALFAGAVATLALMSVLVVLAILGWEQFFTQVHTLFFANGNWTFRLDDTLIRLFPAQFWMDAGIVIAALVLAACTVVLATCWPTKARRESVRRAREDARRRYAESLNAL